MRVIVVYQAGSVGSLIVSPNVHKDHSYGKFINRTVMMWLRHLYKPTENVK